MADAPATFGFEAEAAQLPSKPPPLPPPPPPPPTATTEEARDDDDDDADGRERAVWCEA